MHYNSTKIAQLHNVASKKLRFLKLITISYNTNTDKVCTYFWEIGCNKIFNTDLKKTNKKIIDNK